MIVNLIDRATSDGNIYAGGPAGNAGDLLFMYIEPPGGSTGVVTLTVWLTEADGTQPAYPSNGGSGQVQFSASGWQRMEIANSTRRPRLTVSMAGLPVGATMSVFLDA